MLSRREMRVTEEVPQTSWHGSGRAWALAVATACAGFWVTAGLAVYSPDAPILAYLLAFSCVVACTLGSAANAPASARTCVWGCMVGLVLLLGAALGRSHLSLLLSGSGVLMGLLLLGTGIGALVGRRIQHPGHLLFVAVVSTVADIWSVTQPGGISKAIVEEPLALSLAALPWPMLGSSELAPLLGVGDVVFTGLYLAASRTHALPLRRSVLALAAGYAITTLLVIATERPIPVLPLLGACMVLAQPKAREVAAPDRRRGAWALTLLVSALALWFLQRSL
jgi:hypothetical protein